MLLLLSLLLYCGKFASNFWLNSGKFASNFWLNSGKFASTCDSIYGKEKVLRIILILYASSTISSSFSFTGFASITCLNNKYKPVIVTHIRNTAANTTSGINGSGING